MTEFDPLKKYCPCDDCQCRLKIDCTNKECSCCGDKLYKHWDEQK